MKTNLLCIVALAGLTLATLSPCARAVAQETPAAQSAAPALSQDVIWWGRTRQEDGSVAEEPLSPTLAKDLRKKLASVQVALEVERNFDEALRELRFLSLSASRRGYAERKDLVIELALARAGVLSKLGQNELAIETLDHVFRRSMYSLDISNLIFVSVGAEELQINEAAGKDPRVISLRAQLQSQSKAAPRFGDDKIASIVASAIQIGDINRTRDLGERALPTLQLMAAEDFDSLTQSNMDPLKHMLGISLSATAEFIRKHFDDGGALWKTRILRLMREEGVLQSSYFGSDGDRSFLRTPEWLPVVERLIEEPTTARESMGYACALARFDLLSPALQRSLVRLLCSADAAMAQYVQQSFQEISGRASLLPVFAGALASPHAGVRAFAAEQLLRYNSSPDLIAASSHADPKVRIVVAKALRTHAVYSKQTGRVDGALVPEISESDRAVLAKLATDAVVEVRAEAATSIASLSQPLGDEVYSKLVNDADPRVRASMLYAKLPIELKVRLAASLATDKDVTVLDRFDLFLFDLLQALSNKDGGTLDVRYVPVIDARIRNSAREFNWLRGDSRRVADYVSPSREGLQVILGWCLENRCPHATSVLLNRITSQCPTGDTSAPYTRPSQSAQAFGLPFTPAQFRQFFEKVAAVDRNGLSRLTQALTNLQDDLSVQFLPIAEDQKQPRHVRTMALRIAAGTAKPSIVPTVLNVLRDEREPASYASSDTLVAIAGTAYVLDGDSAAQVLAQALSPTGKIPLDAFNAFAAGYVLQNKLSAKDSDAILALWADKQSVWDAVIDAALDQVATRPRAAQGDWLLRGLRDNEHFVHTLTLIGESRDPSYLPALKSMLGSDYALERFKKDPFNSRAMVINCLTRYFDDAAAEILLETAGSTADSNLRNAAFAGLETIRKYRAEKGRWEESRTSKEATASAVKELVLLLDDTNPAVRAQAARGLGTLHALEQMPRLVRLLKDSDESVRKAASEALGVLNAPTKQD